MWVHPLRGNRCAVFWTSILKNVSCAFRDFFPLRIYNCTVVAQAINWYLTADDFESDPWHLFSTTVFSFFSFYWCDLKGELLYTFLIACVYTLVYMCICRNFVQGCTNKTRCALSKSLYKTISDKFGAGSVKYCCYWQTMKHTFTYI